MSYRKVSKWKRRSSPFGKLTIIRSNATSVGDCMRDLDNRDLITGDFLVVTGDVVSNLDLAPALARHKARREKDKNAIMTMILRETDANGLDSRRSKRPVFVIDPREDRCLHYEVIGGKKSKSKRLLLDPDFFSAHGEIEVREDLIDCRIDICTVDVLAQWNENFDYQSMRKSFLFGVLKDYELNGKTVHTHIVTDQYATRVQDLSTYASISKDMAKRRTFPYCPDSNFLDDQSYRFTADKVYLEDEVILGRTAVINDRSVVGRETAVGEGSIISRSVVGRHCLIGKNVTIEDSYIWDDVRIEDDSTIHHSIVADGSKIGAGSNIGPGSLITYNTDIPFASKEVSSDTPGKTATGINASTDFDSDSESEVPTLYVHASSASSRSSISTIHSHQTSEISDDEDELDHRPSSALSTSSFDVDPSLQPGQTQKSAAAAADATRAFNAEATASILDGLQKGDKAETIFLELNSYRLSVDASQHAVRAAVASAFLQRVRQLMQGESTRTADEEDEEDESDPAAPKANETETSNSNTKLPAETAIKRVFDPSVPLLERVLLIDRTSTSAANTDADADVREGKIDFLLELQRLCAQWPNINTTPTSRPNAMNPNRETFSLAEGTNVLGLLLKQLYDLDLVEEEEVLAWWDDRRSSHNSALSHVRSFDASTAGMGTKLSAEGFVEWLRNAEEEDDDEDEDEDEEEDEEDEDEDD